MKVLEVVKRLPEKAGEVELFYTEKEGKPEREDKKIVIPLTLDTEIFPLTNELQVLIVSDDEVYFGGTDDSPERTPFLVEIEESLLTTYSTEGENAFYDALVPPLIKFFASHPKNPFRQEQPELFNNMPSHEYKMRQGDIFATPMPYDKEELRTLQELLGVYGDRCIELTEKTEFPLFSTRHTFTGYGTEISRRAYWLGTGIVKAPDHNPMLLKDHLFLIAQTQGLVDSFNAD